MPKIKTKRAAAKRFTVTGTGKFVAQRSGKRHLLTHKSRKRKRNLRSDYVVSDAMKRSIKRMLPNL